MKFFLQSAPLRLALLLLLLCCGNAPAQNIGDREIPEAPADTIPDRSTIPDFDLVSFGFEFVPSPQGGDFFPEYSKLGGSGTLEGYMMPSAMLRFATRGMLRIVLYGAYAGGDFTDIYDVLDTARPNRTLASIVEQFNITSIPVLVGVEYTPIREQFTTYVGACAGFAYSNVEWTTMVRGNENVGFDRPATNIREGGFHPAYRIYAGIDYRFDRNLWSRGAVRGIFLEGSYLGIPIRRDYFAAVRGAGREVQSLPGGDDATLDIGGVSFTIGVNLQFVRQ